MTDAEQREAARQFVNRWMGKGKEDEDGRSYWIDLLTNVLGMDNVTERLNFEKKVVIDGNTKRIDVYIPETRVIIEQKSLGKALDQKIRNSGDVDLTPFEQADRYNGKLTFDERARWIVTSNFAEIWIYDMNQKQPEPTKIALDELQSKYPLLDFLVKKEVKTISHEMEVSIKAGDIVGLIYDAFLKQYRIPDIKEKDETSEQKEKREHKLKSLNALCVRIVFCLYAEDAGIFGKRNMFHEEKFKVSVDGEEAGSLYVQVPEKETEGSEEEPETELSEEQQREKELQDMIVQYNQKKNDPQYYYLPDEWNGKHLEWEQPKDKTGNLLSALGLAAAVAAVIAKKREEQNAQIKRREQMLMDYPGLIMKFTLLVQAGLTARKAFQKIALDYGKREDGKKREAYEEIRVACYEMDSGISEAEAYRRFGERCGQVKYKTLSTLLIQNIQKGSRYLADLLEKESVEAWEERKRKARVLGDTAATKLLLPMVLMLLVVMAVIMLPACLSFYGG